MPNPDHALAEGDPLYTSWIDIFGNDVSGNRSKSWNKHWNVYISHRNLPRKLLQQEFHVHFVSISPVASIAKQFHGIKKVIELTHKQPVKVCHGSTGVQTCFKLYVNCGPGDNPAQKSDVGYHELFQVGIARSASAILSDIETQVAKACLGMVQTVQNKQTKNGIKDAYIQFWIDNLIKHAWTLRKNNPEQSTADIQAELLDWVKDNKKDIYNPFLSLAVEILHTILLGIMKYLWHGSHTSWTAQQKETYTIRLQSTERSGLSIHAIQANYIMQYANSLIGQQFKTLAQVNVFHVYNLIDANQFLLTKAVGEFAALLWVPEIRNMEEYLSDIDICVANMLDLFATINPSKLVSKIKLHLLMHLKDDIHHFGPIVGVATEVFECFNAIFRYSFQMGRQEVLKHRLTGGWSLMPNEEWQRPGSSIRTFMEDHPTLQALIGWTSSELIMNGRMTGSKALNHTSEDQNSQWTACHYIVARSGDKCSKGSWIFARSTLHSSQIIMGHINDILATDDGKPRCQEERTYIVIPPLDIEFQYNVQHDCPQAKCGATGQQPLMQEHVESGVIKHCIEHKPLEKFVINTHAFHNAHLLCSVLPRSLVAPILLNQGRQEKHFEMVKGLREAHADQKKLESTKVADGTESGLSTKTGLDMEIVDDANFVKKCKPTHNAWPGQGKQTRLNKEMDQTTDSAPALMPQHFRFVVETGLQ
ncbi:hypothetical protein CPB84DRAFT_1816358 [Gymnopilus junonius]|uniref:Uncharacterized protein n=1 Tax=Gymnopilus junonius TaxID=109634 RepID=A0A9P5TKV8_GYMJU|nr:hypothetical protein CPB84DRAFT_1816358 [Gymnopilus junonius]